jgi:hypothetical protein
MHHCLAQIFGAGLAAGLPKRHLVRGTVIFQDQRMVHGDIRRALLEVAYRVAARGHDIPKQLVRFRHRAGGAVYEVRLDTLPGLYEARAITRPKWTDAERVDPLGAVVEAGFRLPPIACLKGAVILRAAKLSPQSLCAAFSLNEESGNAPNHNHYESGD